MAGGYVVVWPKCRVTVKDKSKVLERGDTVPTEVSAVELENLVSFGAITGALVPGPETKAEKVTEPPAKSDKVEDILAEVGADKEKAAAALAAEREARGDKARKTLVEPLEALLAADS